jgi:small subunit ribosomal protein S18e
MCVISAGELGPDEIEKIVTVISRPLQFIPPWMVNRTKDIKDGKTTHVVANGLDSKLRDSLERLWKIK